ncbi:hypothetical protein HI914_05699 [Erysiphe necator]|nr:hypothetical protein HI914_05699 [Erysiphe necator]
MFISPSFTRSVGGNIIFQMTIKLNRYEVYKSIKIAKHEIEFNKQTTFTSKIIFNNFLLNFLKEI